MMGTVASLSPWRFSRFDKAVGLVLLVAFGLTTVMVQQSGQFPGATRASGVLFLAWDAANRSQVFWLRPGQTEPASLTQEETDILNFTVAPDGTQIVYSLRRLDGRSDLWAIGTDGRRRRPLLRCEDALCSQPRWLPGGQRLVYERRSAATAGSPPGSPRLWWLDLVTGETVSVFQDSQWLGWGAAFSANGRWLSYVSPIAQEIQAYNLETGQTVHIPSRSGEPAVWGMGNGVTDMLLLTDILLDEDKFAVHLFAINMATNEVLNLSGEAAEVNDSSPSWSPNGRWLAFARKGAPVTEGKQIWLIETNGHNPINLTQNPSIHFSAPAWSPDSQQLVFQGYELARPEAEPAIWLYNLADQQLQLIAAPGVQPVWIP